LILIFAVVYFVIGMKVRLERSSGLFLGSTPNEVSAEAIADKINDICDFSFDSTRPTNAGDAFPAMMAARGKGSVHVPSEPSLANNTSQSTSQVVLESDVGFLALNTLLQTNKEQYVAYPIMFYRKNVILCAYRSAELATQCRTKVVFSIIDEQSKTPLKYWYMDFKSAPPSITLITQSEIEALKPSAVLTCTDKTVLSLFRGKLGPEMAYMRGLLKIQGSMGAATRIKALLEVSASLKL
jgi:hypothetical protein